jgi:hypothetical protein
VGKLSSTGKVFFGVGVALGITAVIHFSRGNHWVALSIGTTAVAEFALAYATTRQVKG